MKKLFYLLSCVAFVMAMGLSNSTLHAASLADNMVMIVSEVSNNTTMPDRYAYCISDGRGRTRDGENVSPAISWTKGPPGTQSYAIIVVDPDAPAAITVPNPMEIDPTPAPIAADAPRQNFYHWVVTDIPAKITRLSGRNVLKYGTLGKNGYAGGSRGANGYDGPCPAWNDERLHHYHFEIFALDVPKLSLQPGFNGPQAEAAMNGHILARGEVVGTYSNNMNLKDDIKTQ